MTCLFLFWKHLAITDWIEDNHHCQVLRCWYRMTFSDINYPITMSTMQAREDRLIGRILDPTHPTHLPAPISLGSPLRGLKFVICDPCAASTLCDPLWCIPPLWSTVRSTMIRPSQEFPIPHQPQGAPSHLPIQLISSQVLTSRDSWSQKYFDSSVSFGAKKQDIGNIGQVGRTALPSQLPVMSNYFCKVTVVENVHRVLLDRSS